MDRPLVSVCIPVYRSEAWVGDAISSVLEQTLQDFEIVVVDNASPDRTADVVRAFGDGRIQLFVNPRDIGPINNHNRSVELSRAPLVKILHADDTLAPDCLERMVRLLRDQPSAGMVFCRRRAVVDDPDDRALVWFANRQRAIHLGFGELGALNDGRRLFDRYLQTGMVANWVGEQTAVMVRRVCFEELGLFNPRVRQAGDLEMWLRIFLRYDVGFIDEELVTYRFGHSNLTALNISAGYSWIDRLWIFESLVSQEPALRESAAMRQLFRMEWLTLVKQFVRQLPDTRLSTTRLRLLAEFLAYRLSCRAGRAPALYPRLPRLVA